MSDHTKGGVATSAAAFGIPYSSIAVASIVSLDSRYALNSLLAAIGIAARKELVHRLRAWVH